MFSTMLVQLNQLFMTNYLFNYYELTQITEVIYSEPNLYCMCDVGFYINLGQNTNL